MLSIIKKKTKSLVSPVSKQGSRVRRRSITSGHSQISALSKMVRSTTLKSGSKEEGNKKRAAFKNNKVFSGIDINLPGLEKSSSFNSV